MKRNKSPGNGVDIRRHHPGSSEASGESALRNAARCGDGFEKGPLLIEAPIRNCSGTHAKTCPSTETLHRVCFILFVPTKSSPMQSGFSLSTWCLLSKNCACGAPHGNPTPPLKSHPGAGKSPCSHPGAQRHTGLLKATAPPAANLQVLQAPRNIILWCTGVAPT